MHGRVRRVASEFEIRAAALRWLRLVSADGTEPLSWDQLMKDFVVDGKALALIGQQGIRKPAGWKAPLSIRTSAKRGQDRPYDDAVGPDGFQRYKERSGAAGAAENAALRVAASDTVPLIWFVGVRDGVYNVVAPVYVLAEEPAQHQFVLAVSPQQRHLFRGTQSPVEEDLRRYVVAETRRRLHQPLFSAKVMAAYGTRCAVCSLGHRELLDAAHITPDVQAQGFAVVSNGLALCKIHHAAYDRNILGIRPDLVVEISERLLHEIDGPMLRYGLQERHGKHLMNVPISRRERPDPIRLEDRWLQFRDSAT